MEAPQPILGDGYSGNHIDLTSGVLYFEDSPTDEAHRSAQWQHEVSHWIRYHGSTVGYLLNALTASRCHLALAALKDLDAADLSRVLGLRASGQALWQIEQPYKPELVGEEFAIFGQMWVDSYWLWNALFDFKSVDGFRSSPEESSAFGLADTWAFLAEGVGFYPYPGNDAARAWLHGPVTRAGRGANELTTRLIWECASTLDELLAAAVVGGADDLPLDQVVAASPSWMTEHQRMAMIKLRETSYGLPWKVADAIFGSATIKELMFIIDFALNPPLPFIDLGIGVDSAPYRQSCSWEELYPPARFVHACQSMVSGEIREAIKGSKIAMRPHHEILEMLAAGSGLRVTVYGAPTMDVFPSVGQALASKIPFRSANIAVSRQLLRIRQMSPLWALFPRVDWPLAATGFVFSQPDLQEAFELGLSPFIIAQDRRLEVRTSLAEGYLRDAALVRLVDSFAQDLGPMRTVRVPAPWDYQGFLKGSEESLFTFLEWGEGQRSAWSRLLPGGS